MPRLSSHALPAADRHEFPLDGRRVQRHHAHHSVGVFSLLIFAAMILAAIAHSGWFRIYSIATLVVVVSFGGASAFAMRGIAINVTPWAGGFERINAYAYFAWLVVLALTVIDRDRARQNGVSRT